MRVNVIRSILRVILHYEHEHDLRRYFSGNEGTDGVAGGEFPVSVAVKGNGTAYVSANRDRSFRLCDQVGVIAARAHRQPLDRV